jgi:cytidylate kinase
VDEVSSRDRQDAGRNISPLIVAEGAQVIDSSELSIEEVVEASVDVLRERGWFDRKGESVMP